jgi:hypothetical protein
VLAFCGELDHGPLAKGPSANNCYVRTAIGAIV